MENKEKAKIIVAIVRQKVEQATNQYINAKADLARNEMGHSLWKKQEDREGNIGFSQNPYNIESSRKIMFKTHKEKTAREEVLRYAIDVFLDKLEIEVNNDPKNG